MLALVRGGGIAGQIADPAQTPVPTQTAPPKTPAHGTVLFERHSTPETPAPAVEPQSPTEAQQAPDGKTSSSTTRRRAARRGLQRHDTAGTSTDAPPTATAQSDAPASASLAAKPCVATCDAVADAVTDAERDAPRLLDTALDLHLNLQTGETATHARLTMQNGSSTPLLRVPLQISSSLQWQSARLVSADGGSVALDLHAHRIATDADHTGSATEVVLVLPAPLTPGATVQLDTFYGGTLGSSAQRLLRLGAPANRAALSDWDTVSDRFTGLRGFGNVLWMPAAAPVALLAAGRDFGQIADAQRERGRGTHVSLRLTLETTGPAPGVGYFLGTAQVLRDAAGDAGAPPAISAPTKADGASSSLANDNADTTSDQPRLYTAEWSRTSVDEAAPSLFVAAAMQHAGALVHIATDDADAAASYSTAADLLRSTLAEWVTPQPARALQIVDLPLTGAQPFAAGDLLVTPLQPEEAKLLAPGLSYPLAAAWLPRGAVPWLAEGLPEFLRTLYLERTMGRAATLSAGRADAIALAAQEAMENLDPPAATDAAVSSSTSQPAAVDRPSLAECAEATCARIKGAFVLGMLRQIVGDAALKQAISGWVASRSAAPERDTATFERLVQASSGKDLQWFFADWVDRDAGLPDLAIVNVAPRRIERGSVTNSVSGPRRPVGGPIGAEVVPQAGGPAEQESTTEASRNRIASADGSWLIAVEVQNNGGAVAEVPVIVRGSGLQNTLPLRIAAHSRATIRVPFETAPEEVFVNDGTTPEQRAGNHHRTITLPGSTR